MKRLYLTFLALIVGSAEAYAGQIQIGQVAGNTAGGANSGLTANYVNATGGVLCAGAIYQGNACVGAGTANVSASAGTFVKRGYDIILFSGAQQGTTAPSPYAGYSKTTVAPAGSTLSDGTDSVTFAMISDDVANNNSRNVWMGGSVGAITIPVGVFGVQDVWTMLNNEFGPAGANDTTIAFNFGNTSNATTNLTQVVVNLTNGAANGGGQSAANGNGQIRSALDCVVPGASTCNTLAEGPLASSSILTSSVIVNNGIATDGVVDVLTRQIYTTTYNNAVGSVFAGSTGNAVLDDQGFFFGGAYNDMYLVSISVKENSATLNTSYTGLSAISVDTVPEPSTWLLLTSAFGAIGLLRGRKK